MKKLLFLFSVLLSAVGAWAQGEDMLSTPLTLEAVEAGTITFNNQAAGPVTYRVNGGEAQTIESKTTGEIMLKAGDKVAFFGDNSNYYEAAGYVSSRIACSADCYIYGNIMSLVSSLNYATADKLESEYTFYYLFSGNSHLKNHPSYQLMLPATTLAGHCYSYMFAGCTGLTEAPALPATTLAGSCYRGMFDSCTGLSLAPELPATILAKHCYSRMFSGCTELTKAPGTLPATTLTTGCYEEMFKGCAGLINAPELPATTLASSCYDYMFRGCTGLTKAPKLPATTLASSCYYGMFRSCTGLNEAPELPATTLASYCYCDMFYGCTGLTEAPELPATTLADYCYSGMFNGCTNLSSVTCLATDISAAGATSGWLKDVSAIGTFYKHPDMKNWETGTSGIPEGWKVVDYNPTGISATTASAKKTSTTTYDLRGMKSTGGKKGLKVVGDKKILTR